MWVLQEGAVTMHRGLWAVWGLVACACHFVKSVACAPARGWLSAATAWMCHMQGKAGFDPQYLPPFAAPEKCPVLLLY